LLQGLRGNEKSVDIDGNVTPNSLGKYVYREIVNLPKEKKPKQIPLTKSELSGDIILAHHSHLVRQQGSKSSSPKDQILAIMDEGNNHFSTGNYNEAIKCYDKAIKINPNNAMAWNNKGNALSELKIYDESIK
jgi:Flp pilus assembly protein TadD